MVVLVGLRPAIAQRDAGRLLERDVEEYGRPVARRAREPVARSVAETPRFCECARCEDC